MRILLQLLTTIFGRAGHDHRARRAPLDVYLKPLIVLVIAVLVGPDLLAFVEITTLLEVLGASMFIVAFAAGYRLLAARALGWLRRLLLPDEFIWLLAMRGQPLAIVFGSLFVARNVLVLAVLGFMLWLGVAILSGIAA